MKMNWKKRWMSLGVAVTAVFALLPTECIQADTNMVFINEVESSDAGGGNDWIEIVNAGKTDVDISGWFVSDDQKLNRLSDGSTWSIAEGTILKAGEVLVLEDTIDFDFGLGKADEANLYNKDSVCMDSYAWSGHAAGTYARVPDGTGEFVDQEPTKGSLNDQEGGGSKEEFSVVKLVINEINSAPDDWVELLNMGTEKLDLSGFEIRDNSDDHRWKFPEGTTVEPGALVLVKDITIGEVYDDQTDSYAAGEFQAAIGIGSGDSIRLYDAEGNLLDSYTWTSHASYGGQESAASYGRYPDGTGSFTLMPETPGKTNTWFAPEIVINEVESNGDATDWVEIYNAGTTAIDISGWYILDNDPVKHAGDVVPLKEGTVINPGDYYVFDGATDFGFGLGGEDCVTVFTKDGIVAAEFSWTAHASGVYARIPDGTGEFVDFETATKGAANVVVNPVVLNEIQSNDPDGGPDWIELANPTGEALDISGLVIKDDDDSHEYVIPAGTLIPANDFLIVTDDDLGFGLGKNDMVRIFENGILIAETTWPNHTDPTWGLYPDVNGSEYRNTKEATPGAANIFEGIPEVIAWPGAEEVTTFDQEATFFEDSSGLDFYHGQLYAVDNGTGTFWVLDVAADGSLSFAEGFENGKRVRFQKDAGNTAAPGPDAEGITVDGNGFVYIASERDNGAKGVNYNVILKVDPREAGSDLVALQEWDLTASLPQVAANMGIEAVEWVSNADLNGKLWDQNTQDVFDTSNYPDAVADGVFFVALEDNGHVYAYILNTDGSVVQIADIDGGLGGAMALDYDTYEKVLWIVADDGYGNKAAVASFLGEKTPLITHVMPPSGVDVARNNEGFAIAEAEFTVDGQRTVYRFADGFKTGALTIGSMNSSYQNPDSGDGSGQEPTPPAGGNGAGETPSDANGTGGTASEGNDVSNAPAGTGSTADLTPGSQGDAKAPVNVVNTGDSNGPQWGIALAASILVLVILGMIQQRRKQIHH